MKQLPNCLQAKAVVRQSDMRRTQRECSCRVIKVVCCGDISISNVKPPILPNYNPITLPSAWRDKKRYQSCHRYTLHSTVKVDSTLTQMSRVRVESAVKNQGYESSQSRIKLIVIRVRVNSTRHCLSQSWVTDFSEEKTSRSCIY